MTSVGECIQGLTQRLLPLTMCEYDIDCEPVADLRDDAGRDRHATTMAELGCAWLRHLRRGEDAPSWPVAERLEADGFAGMLVTSFAPNHSGPLQPDPLALGPDLPTRVAVFDPTGRLPRDQLSWG